MRTVYIDCGMGAAGDMLTAALLELFPDPDAVLAELNALGVPGVEYRRESAVRRGVAGTRVSVLVRGAEEDERHSHSSGLRDIGGVVSGLALPEKVRTDVMNVYGLIAGAESKVHGVPVSEVHFHEVGALDAVADVAAVCLLMDRLAPDEVVASPVHVGSGYVRCAHGLLPVPAPAAAELLKGVPIYGGEIEGELCTPTGAALLKYFVRRFGPLPPMETEAVGYGMGKRDYPRANCVRVFLGGSGTGRDRAAVLSCNIDDMSAEEMGYAMERLFEAGAREVYAVPAVMKKGRPGTLLEVLCDPADRDRMAERIFRYTSTIGIRTTELDRYVLDRRTEIRQTPCGEVREKLSSGWGVTRRKPEYEDLARIARERDISIAEARKLLE